MEFFKATYNKEQDMVVIQADSYGDAMAILMREYPLHSIMDWDVKKLTPPSKFHEKMMKQNWISYLTQHGEENR